MSNGIISLIAISIIVGIFVFGYLINKGIKLCNENNAIGIILLFISLNILGLVIGFALLYNSNNNPTVIKRKEEKLKQKLENLDKIKSKQNNIPPQS